MPVFLARRTLVRNELEGWFGDIYDQIRVAGTYNLINNAAVMAEKKVGVVFCFQLQNRFDGLKYIPLYRRWRRGLYWSGKNPRSHPRAVRQFLRFVKEYRDITPEASM